MEKSKSIFKSFYFWISATLAFYFIVTMVILPFTIKSQSISFIKNNLNHTASLEKVKFNPFIFELQLQNFNLSNNNNEFVAGFENITVDFNLLKTIYHQTVIFDSIHIVKPKIDVIQQKNGELNLLKLIPKSNSDKIENSEMNKEENNEVIPLKLNIVKIEQSEIYFTDYSLEKPFKVSIKPKDYTVLNLSTVFENTGTYDFNVSINEHSSIKGSGTISLNPIKIDGNIELNSIHLADFWPRVENEFKFFINNSILDFNTKFNLSYMKNKLEANILNSNTKLKDFALGSKNNNEKLISFESFNIDNLSLSYPQQNIQIDNVKLNSFYTNLVLEENYQTNIQKLFINEKETVDKKESTNNEEQPSKWSVSIKNFDLVNAKLDAKDTNTQTPFVTSVDNINLNVKNINLEDDSKFDYSFNSDLHKKGKLQANGFISIKPLEVNSDYIISNIPINMFQSYLSENLNIDITQGDFNSKGNFKLQTNNTIKLETNSNIKDIDVKNKNESLVKFKKINIDKLVFNQENNSLKIKSIDFENPYAKVFIDKDKTTNFSDIVKKTTKKDDIHKTTKKEEQPQKELIFDLGGINIKKGSMNFTDLSLPLPFKTYIDSLNGNVSKLSSSSIKPSNIKIDGVIDKYGLAKINGALDYKNIKQNTKINMLFKNISIKNLSPYSMEFIGRKIDDGKLTLDLNYDILNSKLNASNKIIVNKIQMGEETNSDKTIPIDLAIALLEDTSGLIDISLPIEGDVDSPDFKLGSIIGKAFVNMIIKIVASPFTLLGNLLGVEPNELKYVEYEAGESKLLPPALEKVDKVAKALNTRPNLAIKINKIYDGEKDLQAIKIKKFNNKLDNLISKLNKEHKDKDTYIMALENMYLTTKKEEKELEDLKKNFIEIKEGKEVFNKVSYTNNLKQYQIDLQSVPKEELEDLAQKRVSSITSYIQKKHDISANRIIIKELEVIEEENDNKWVKSELEITVKQK